MIKIIFVDDESNLLDGLKRLLRKKKDEWDMSFVRSGQDALQCLDKEKYDIIVTDYKMPGMDGLKLLELAKSRHKEIRRVILSGQSESEIFVKAKEIADAYVSKPCNSDELISAIEGVKY